MISGSSLFIAFFVLLHQHNNIKFEVCLIAQYSQVLKPRRSVPYDLIDLTTSKTLYLAEICKAKDVLMT